MEPDSPALVEHNKPMTIDTHPYDIIIIYPFHRVHQRLFCSISWNIARFYVIKHDNTISHFKILYAFWLTNVLLMKVAVWGKTEKNRVKLAKPHAPAGNRHQAAGSWWDNPAQRQQAEYVSRQQPPDTSSLIYRCMHPLYITFVLGWAVIQTTLEAKRQQLQAAGCSYRQTRTNISIICNQPSSRSACVFTWLVQCRNNFKI